MNSQQELDAAIDIISELSESLHNHEQIQIILANISKGIREKIIRPKKTNKSNYGLFSSKAKQDENIYLDVANLLELLFKNPAYRILFKDFLSNLPAYFLNLDVLEDLIIKRISDHSIDEDTTIELITFYLNRNGKLSKLLPKRNNLHVYPYSEADSSLLNCLIIAKFDKAILFLKNQTDFNTSLHTDVLLSNLKNEEMFEYARRFIDFSMSDIRFQSMRENMLIEFIKVYPARIAGLKNTNEGGLLAYAASKGYSSLIDYLANNHFKDFSSVSEACINSVKIAQQLRNHNIKVRGARNNIYCLELMLANNKVLPSESLSVDSKVAIIVSNNLPHLVNYILENVANELLTRDIVQNIIKQFAYIAHPGILEKAVKLMHHSIEQYATNKILAQLFKNHLSHPGSPVLIELLLKNFATVIIDYFNNVLEVNSLANTIAGVTDPKIICLLLRYGFTVSDDKIIECHRIACVENNEQEIALLSQFLKDKTNHWKYSHSEEKRPLPNENDDRLHELYGQGISQKQYEIFQTKMVDMVVGHLLNQTFKVLPDNQDLPTTISNAEATLSSDDDDNNISGFNLKIVNDDDYDSDESPPVAARGLSPVSFKDEYEVVFMEAKYASQCNFITLGIYRYWIAKISQSDEYECFGSLRTHGLSTPIEGARYNYYYQKFINNYPVYKDLLEINADFATDNTRPLCAIVGTIDGEPIRLTTYGISSGGYGWIHTPSNLLPKILTHCQKLIDGIVDLKIDNQQPEHIKTLSNKIGQLHWWLAHACPFQRGSASITEVVSRALFKFHGVEVSWKLMPDCEALITPKESDYVANYFSLLNVELLPLKKALAVDLSTRKKP